MAIIRATRLAKNTRINWTCWATTAPNTCAASVPHHNKGKKYSAKTRGKPNALLRSTAQKAYGKRKDSLRTFASATSSDTSIMSLLDLPNVPTFTVSETDPSSWTGDLLVLGLFEDAFDSEKNELTSSANLGGFSKEVQAVIVDLLSDPEFKLKPASSKVLRCAFAGAPKHIAIVGLGKKPDGKSKPNWGKTAMHQLGNCIKTLSKQNRCTTAAVFVPSDGVAVQEIAQGAFMGGYESTRFKSSSSKGCALGSIELLSKSITSKEMGDAVAKALAFSQGVTVARYLVEAPPNTASPEHLNSCAIMIADTFKDNFVLTTYDRKQCEEMGMGCYLGVAEASDAPPQFIHLKYTPKSGVVKAKIALVGKGVTFDSGGYNIKAGGGSMIEMMKFDMGGAGAVLGAAYAVGGLKPDNVEVHFITAACENMINGHGLRPGDVLTASNGKTVEVNNTDAEGRLTLCDAITFASKQGAETIVDIATLTGACMVALGQGIGGLYSNSDDLASALSSGGAVHGEKLWRMPLEDQYMEHLKSPIADMKNTGVRWGGSITAALFLKEFVPENVDWAHIDMAGPVWDDKNGGATGFGVATLSQYVLSKSQSA